MSEIQEALAAASSAEEVETVETTEAPSETTETVETETEPKAETPEVQTELYELPDGRKVDAKTLASEWKEKFMPDYTRKSQELAKVRQPEPKPETETGPKWKDPNWQPQTYQELLDAAEERVRSSIEAERQAEAQHKEQLNSWVQTQLDEIKQSEPNLSEELLFQHANKYGFGDLKTAYQNMKDFNLAVKHVEQKVVKNMKAREAEPIAAKPNAGESDDDIDFYSVVNDRASAVERLSRITGK